MQETKNLKEYIPLNFTFESQISSKYFFAITFFDDNNTNFSKWRKQSNFFCAVMHFARLYRLSSSIQLLIQIQISVFELKFIFIFCVRWNIYIFSQFRKATCCGYAVCIGGFDERSSYTQHFNEWFYALRYVSIRQFLFQRALLLFVIFFLSWCMERTHTWILNNLRLRVE